MLAIGDQVQVVGKLDILGNLLQYIDAETFAALFDICPPSLCCVTTKKKQEQNNKQVSLAAAMIIIFGNIEQVVCVDLTCKSTLKSNLYETFMSPPLVLNTTLSCFCFHSPGFIDMTAPMNKYHPGTFSPPSSGHSVQEWQKTWGVRKKNKNKLFSSSPSVSLEKGDLTALHLQALRHLRIWIWRRV